MTDYDGEPDEHRHQREDRDAQEATGATESIVVAGQVLRDVQWAIRTGNADKLAPGVYVTENPIMIDGPLRRRATGDTRAALTERERERKRDLERRDDAAT